MERTLHAPTRLAIVAALTMNGGSELTVGSMNSQNQIRSERQPPGAARRERSSSVMEEW